MTDIEWAMVHYDGNNDEPYADLVVDALRQKRETDALAAEYGIDAKTMLTLAKSQIKTTKSNIELSERLEEAETLIAKLAVLCDVPKERRDTLLCRHINRPGDYMGCGYDFLDAFYRIWDEFMETEDEDYYHGIMEKIENQLERNKKNG